MSNAERDPEELDVGGAAGVGTSPEPQRLDAREVPLGGPRALLVRRTLPQRQIRTVGAFCFVDHYGPVRPRDEATQVMSVPPHPHMGLQTVSWLLAGTVDHRDSVGSTQQIRPGQLNLMTAGSGVSHSEYSVGPGELHGVQVWVALPEEHRDQAPHFEHHDDLPLTTSGDITAIVIMGSSEGATSSAVAYSPVVAVELGVSTGGSGRWPLDSSFEHAVLLVQGSASVNGALVPHGAMQYLGWGKRELRLESATGARALLLGGEPFTEQLLMWWNFVGRSHDEIVQARHDWEDGERFGRVVGDDHPPLAAPPLPTSVLRPRASRPLS